MHSVRISNKVTGFTVLCPPHKSDWDISEAGTSEAGTSEVGTSEDNVISCPQDNLNPFSIRTNTQCCVVSPENLTIPTLSASLTPRSGIVPKITFIIPTIGRDTLPDAIDCLLNQTCQEWKAIIIFDGIEPTIRISDDRITIIKCEKKHDRTFFHSAGYVRNYGIQFATTEWVAFLDDDDGIKPTYVETFLKEIADYDNDVIIFRMVKTDYAKLSVSYADKLNNMKPNEIKVEHLYDTNPNNEEERLFRLLYTMPFNNTDNFYKSEVGISFAAKKSLFDSGIVFETSAVEDFNFLDEVRKNKHKMMISPFLLYHVNNYDFKIYSISNRVFINHSEDLRISV